MTALGWLLASLGIVGAVLNLLKLRVCFVVWIASNVGLIYLNASQGRMDQAALFGAFTVTSVLGWFNWGRGA